MKRMFAMLMCLALSLSLIPAASAEDIEIIETEEAEDLIEIVEPDAAPAEAAVPNADISINATNFPDENFRSYVSTKIDKDGNGLLSTAEIADAKEFHLFSRDITSLKGIEYFTALTYLDCGENELTSLDLSKNTELFQLECQRNGLTELDLSKNTKLDSLLCLENQLTSLDLSNNTELTYLSCWNNKLNTLNLTNCTKLEKLECWGNELTSLDLSGFRRLREVSCNDNKLKTLNVAGCTALDNLGCAYNELTSLILDKNLSLTSLGCSHNQLSMLDLKYAVNLKYLSCYANDITWLDIGNCEGLRNAYVDGNKETEESGDGYTYDKYYINWNGKNGTLIVDQSVFIETENLDPEQTGLSITTQPTDQSGKLGDVLSYEVGAVGNDLTYQWYYYLSEGDPERHAVGDDSPILHWTVSNFELYTEAYSEYFGCNVNVIIYCLVVDSYGAYLYTDKCGLTVLTDITAQPKNVTVKEGETAKFTVEAVGVDLSYQWQYNNGSGWKDSSQTGYKTATLSVPATAARNGYQYRCVIKSYRYDDSQSTEKISNAATLTVTSSSKPTITTQPKSITATAGSTAKFTVAATGATSYQWQWRSSSSGTWKDCTSATTGYNKATLQVNATTARNGYQYRCKVTNGKGTTTSNNATLTVTSSSKPTITTQPSNRTAAAGATVSFKVVATGATSYQWQYRTSSTGEWKNSTASSAKTATLSITAESYRNGYQYRCKVTNSVGTTTSNAATLTVTSSSKPTITTQPKSVTATAGSTAKFTVAATGATSYQWQWRSSSSGTWKDCTSTTTGYNKATLQVSATTARNGYQYRCKVTNAAGTTTSNIATLTVTSGTSKPTITTQPKSVTAAPGKSVTFTVTASGATSYQWQFRTSSTGEWGDSTATGCKTATLTITAETWRSGYQYRCKVTNSNGTTISSAATLTVSDAGKPTITTQPKSQTVSAGTTVSFKVAASGATSYQWQFRTSSAGQWGNCTSTGAQTATLTITAETWRSGYQYRCIVKNDNGTTTSSAATLTVN